MPIKKATKTHTSSRKKALASSAKKRRTKKATAKASESEFEPNISEAEWLKLRKLTLKMAQMVYDDYQKGKFERLFF